MQNVQVFLQHFKRLFSGQNINFLTAKKWKQFDIESWALDNLFHIATHNATTCYGFCDKLKYQHVCLLGVKIQFQQRIQRQCNKRQFVGSRQLLRQQSRGSLLKIVHFYCNGGRNNVNQLRSPANALLCKINFPQYTVPSAFAQQIFLGGRG